MSPEIRPVTDAAPLRSYIDTHWRRGHVLAHDAEMFRFTYATPWVDRDTWPGGLSVLGLYDGGRMLGFLGAIVTPYPRPRSCWLALWHVLPELKGGGHGGKLLERMQQIAEAQDGWIGTFGAGPEALPVYLKRGYAVRAARRWLYDPHSTATATATAPTGAARQLHGAEAPASAEWLEFRYQRHPRFVYDARPGAVFRTERNGWGVVTHVCRLDPLAPGSSAAVADVFTAGAAQAAAAGVPHLMDCWAFDCPGRGWTLAPEAAPSVFHPVEARGNVTYAVGRPFVVSAVGKGDCDQDRPNAAPVSAAGNLRAVPAGCAGGGCGCQ